MSVIAITDIIDCPTIDALMTRYDSEKNQVLQELRNDWMFSIKNLASQERPQIFHTLGFSGSGKSTLLEYCHENTEIFPEGAFFLGFDRVMESCQSYQDEFEKLGAEEAFLRWEIPARALGYELLEEALKRRLHIVFEHSGARQDHVELLRHVKNDLGYHLTIMETQVDPQKALERNKEKARFQPVEYVLERKKTIDQLRPLYHMLADEWYSFDMGIFPPKQIEHEVR